MPGVRSLRRWRSWRGALGRWGSVGRQSRRDGRGLRSRDNRFAAAGDRLDGIPAWTGWKETGKGSARVRMGPRAGV